MRHIPLLSQTPDAVWLTKAQDLLAALETATTSDERKKIIDDNSNVWGEMKPWLLTLSHQKCWFSEAKDCFSHWDVEHYRPKKSAKDLDGTEHEGYWWLAFQWQNFRICGNAGNRKKGTYFPLRPGCRRRGHGDDVRREEPQLLDPTNVDDPVLLSFNLEGSAIPAPHITDLWEKERVTYSVERYNLDFNPLKDKRKAVWSDCNTAVKEYLSELALYHKDSTNETAKSGVKQAARKIRAMVHETKELSAVARACVMSMGDERVKNLLSTS
jgi:hypothetical protein